MAAAEATVSPSGGLALVQLHQLTSVTGTSISHDRAFLPAAVLTQDGKVMVTQKKEKEKVVIWCLCKACDWYLGKA